MQANPAIFPQARIKKIMKEDQEVKSISNETIIAMAIATEKFLSLLTQNAYQYTQQDGRKTVSYKDLALAVKAVDQFEFLDEVVPMQLSMGDALTRKKEIEISQYLASDGAVVSMDVQRT